VDNFVTHPGFKLHFVPENSFNDTDDRRLDSKLGSMHEFM